MEATVYLAFFAVAFRSSRRNASPREHCHFLANCSRTRTSLALRRREIRLGFGSDVVRDILYYIMRSRGAFRKLPYAFGGAAPLLGVRNQVADLEQEATAVPDAGKLATFGPLVDGAGTEPEPVGCLCHSDEAVAALV